MINQTQTDGVAIVTGAGGDIGCAIAARLLSDGNCVILADLDWAAAQTALESLNAGARAMAVACDITDPAATDALVEAASAFGPVSILVNNAGGVVADSLQSTDNQAWRRDIALNLEGAFNCFKAAEADLKQTGGNIINIASVNGLATFGHPAYSAAKAGLIHFTKNIAVEYGKFGIRANAVAPGTVRTRAWEARATTNPQVFEEAQRWYPLQRIAGVNDIANAVAFLVSDQATAITGVCLPVDCGLLAGQAELARTFSQSNDY